MITIACRPATPQDEPFIRSLIVEAAASELGASAWPAPLRDQVLGMQYTAKRQSHRANFPTAHEIIVHANGEDCGWFMTANLPDELRLADIVVAAHRRRKGIGAAVLQQLISRAETLRLPLTLHVNVTNADALRLYSRLGFEPAGGDEFRRFMRRSLSSSE